MRKVDEEGGTRKVRGSELDATKRKRNGRELEHHEGMPERDENLSGILQQPNKGQENP